MYAVAQPIYMGALQQHSYTRILVVELGQVPGTQGRAQPALPASFAVEQDEARVILRAPVVSRRDPLLLNPNARGEERGHTMREMGRTQDNISFYRIAASWDNVASREHPVQGLDARAHFQALTIPG